MAMVSLGFGPGNEGVIIPQFQIGNFGSPSQGPTPLPNQRETPLPSYNNNVSPQLGNQGPGLLLSFSYKPDGNMLLTLNNIVDDPQSKDTQEKIKPRASDSHHHPQEKVNKCGSHACKCKKASHPPQPHSQSQEEADPEDLELGQRNTGSTDKDPRASASSTGTESEVDIEFMDDSFHVTGGGGQNPEKASATTTIKSNRPSCRISKSRCSLSRSPSLQQSQSMDSHHSHHHNGKQETQEQQPHPPKVMVCSPQFKSCNYYRSKMDRGDSVFPNAEQEFWLNFGSFQHSAAQRVVNKMTEDQKMLEEEARMKKKYNFGGAIHIYSNPNTPSKMSATPSPQCHASVQNYNHSCCKKKPIKLDPLSPLPPLRRTEGFGDLIQICIEK